MDISIVMLRIKVRSAVALCLISSVAPTKDYV